MYVYILETGAMLGQRTGSILGVYSSKKKALGEYQKRIAIATEQGYTIEDDAEPWPYSKYDFIAGAWIGTPSGNRSQNGFTITKRILNKL